MIKRDKHGRELCDHNRERRYCRSCGGSRICQHDKRKNDCKKCGGSGICKHDKHRRICKTCHPLGWAKSILLNSKNKAKREGYKNPNITAEALLSLLSSSTCCAICEQPLLNEIPHLHHHHETGEIYGYAHAVCNKIEGWLNTLTAEQQIKLLQNTISKNAIKGLA